MSQQAHTYAELRQQIHDDLRVQHPEWVQPDGESPLCDLYETRLMESLRSLTQGESDESLASFRNYSDQDAHSSENSPINGNYSDGCIADNSRAKVRPRWRRRSG